MSIVEILESVPRYSHTIAQSLADDVANSCSDPEHEFIMAEVMYVNISDMWHIFEEMFIGLSGIRSPEEIYELGYIIAENIISVAIGCSVPDGEEMQSEFEEAIAYCLECISSDLSTAGWRDSIDFVFTPSKIDVTTLYETVIMIQQHFESAGIESYASVVGWGPEDHTNKRNDILIMHEAIYDNGDDYE